MEQNKITLVIQNKEGSRFINNIETKHEPNAEELLLVTPAGNLDRKLK